MEIERIILAIFFLYFVLITDSIKYVLNCSLQRLLQKSIIFNHIILFLSIYIFTFLLGWYRYESIVIEKFVNRSNRSNRSNTNKTINKINLTLLKYFFYTMLIYLLFLITTKNEYGFIIFFMVSIIILVIIQVYIKGLNPNINDSIKDKIFINKATKKKIINELGLKYNVDIPILLHNISYIYFIIVVAIIFIGMYKYYLRKSKEYKSSWNWIVFFFGNNKCKSL